MSDISELNLKINKTETVKDLQSIQKELENTGKAGDSLIDTLKNIGLSIGFGKLIKESMQLNSNLTAMKNRFDAIFQGSFDVSEFETLRRELGLSKIAATNLMATIGQYAKGTGQSAENVKRITSSLTRAATDYATYMGKTSNEEIQEVARKFAKATLGETGELKEMGIIIDSQAESFKKLTKEIMEATGASEAQAKQLLITKQLIEQTQIATGASSNKVYDGWAQFSNLMDNFKEILKDVGKIFSDVLAPVIGILNSIIEIPFIKSTLAWSTALLSVVVGYGALIATMRKISAAISGLSDKMSSQEKTQSQVALIATKWRIEVTKAEKSYGRIFKMVKENKRHLNFIWGKHAVNLDKYPTYSDLAPWYKGRMHKGITDPAFEDKKLAEDFTNVQRPLNELKRELKNLNIAADDLSEQLLLSMSPSMAAFIGTLEKVGPILKETRAYTLGAAAAEKILAFNRKLSMAEIKNSFKGLKESVMGFFAGFGAAIKGGLGAGLAAVGIALGKILLIVLAIVAAIDGIKGVYNLIQGNPFFKGTMLDSLTGIVSIPEERERLKKEIGTLLKTSIDGINDYKKSLEDIELEKTLKNILPPEQLKLLKERADKLAEATKNAKAALQDPWEGLLRAQLNARLMEAKPDIDPKDLENAKKKLEEANKIFKEASDKYVTALNEEIKAKDLVISKEKEIADADEKFNQELNKLKTTLLNAKDAFSYGYKDGKFQKISQGLTNVKNTIGELEKELAKFGSPVLGLQDKQQDLTTKGLESQRSLLESLFEKTKERYTYEMESLNAQREAAITNLKAMGDLIKSSTQFREITQQGIESTSMEALKLQSRRFDGLSKSELNPVIEQQKQIKEIERQMLTKQATATDALTKINGEMVKVTKHLQNRATKIEVVKP